MGAKYSPLAFGRSHVSLLYKSPSPNVVLTTCTTRSIFFLIAGFSVGGNGLVTQRDHHRSTRMSSLWAMGFGQINVDEIIAWGQPSSVSLASKGFCVLRRPFTNA